MLECLLEGRLLDVPESLVERMKNPSGSSTKEPVDADDAERRERERTFYDSLLKLPYLQIRAFATFLLEHTPFATKHGVKGAEFDTVYVVLDDAGANWNLYSFDKYLSGDSSGKNEQRFLRTRNLFYVCCSRAKRNLAVIDLGARSPAKDAGVESLFGVEHCIRL
ncbi:MAG: hypothetical protein NDJ92_03525 [Thermoanaerobaculia bacterium]|nr:hypothetical protein [Thermoanaerobaculia bacterium]